MEKEKEEKEEKIQPKRTKECQNCGCEVNVEKWTVCPECDTLIHFKLKPDGRIGKTVCHPNGWSAIS